ncbi:MAG TPA: hypothetical protein VNA30_03675 [Mycobacteriales bacterium]|nr:hypothetical protein [Mycobacteriales bacterium]
MPTIFVPALSRVKLARRTGQLGRPVVLGRALSVLGGLGGEMNVFSALVILALACSVAAISPARAEAQACDWFPSTACPAPELRRGAASYPCYPDQIKGDLNSMTYHLPVCKRSAPPERVAGEAMVL